MCGVLGGVIGGELQSWSRGRVLTGVKLSLIRSSDT